jgi:hypothetical protein
MRDREFHDKDRLDQDAFENPLAHAEFEAPEDGPRDWLSAEPLGHEGSSDV